MNPPLVGVVLDIGFQVDVAHDPFQVQQVFIGEPLRNVVELKRNRVRLDRINGMLGNTSPQRRSENLTGLVHNGFDDWCLVCLAIDQLTTKSGFGEYPDDGLWIDLTLRVRAGFDPQ